LSPVFHQLLQRLSILVAETTDVDLLAGTLPASNLVPFAYPLGPIPLFCQLPERRTETDVKGHQMTGASGPVIRATPCRVHRPAKFITASVPKASRMADGCRDERVESWQ
jgi:hypothetical protein